MKNNFVTKHMNTFNKATTHKNIKRDFDLDDEEHIQEGLQEFLDKKESKGKETIEKNS